MMVELLDDMLVCVIPHVMWCTFPFNLSSSNLISVRVDNVKIVNSFIEFRCQFYLYRHGNGVVAFRSVDT